MQKYLILFLLSFSVMAQMGSTTRVGKYDKIDSNTSPLIEVLKDIEAMTTGAWTVPVGTEAQRPASPQDGMFRYNSEANTFEGYTDGEWGPIAGGGGLSVWITGEEYTEDVSVIWEPLSLKIYVANTTHTAAATFAEDIANWTELSNPFDATNLSIADNTLSATNTDGGIELETNGDGDLVTKLDTNSYSLDPQINHGNLIPNASFERADLSDVVCTDATVARIASPLLGENNKFALEITATDVDWTCTITGAASEGQGNLVFKANTDGNATACSMVDGSEQTCDSIRELSVMQSYAIPTVLGSTSNGIRIRGTTSGDKVQLDLVEMMAGQVISNLSVDTPEESYTSSFAPVGFGTVSSASASWKRVGDTIHVSGRFTSGTPTSDQARLNLPTGLLTTSLTSNTVKGVYFREVGGAENKGGAILSTVGQNYVTMSTNLTIGGNTTSGSLTPGTGNEVSSSGTIISFFFSIKIQGWSSNSQAYVSECVGLECVNDFSADFSSSGVLSGSNISGIFSNCTNPGTGVYVCPISAGTTIAPICNANSNTSAVYTNIRCSIDYAATNSTQIGVRCGNPNNNTAANEAFSISCLKRSPDYVERKSIVGAWLGEATYQNEATISLAGSGDFTGGSIKVSRVGNTVTISNLSNLTFASGSLPASAAGAIPSWARPPIRRWNVYYNGSDEIYALSVIDTGILTLRVVDYAGAAKNVTNQGADFSITYTVADSISSPAIYKSCIGLECENHIVLTYNLTTVVDQFGNSYPVVKSGSNNNTKTIDISSLGLTVAPIGNAGEATYGGVIFGQPAATSTSIEIYTYVPDTGANADREFTVTLTKRNPDYLANRTIVQNTIEVQGGFKVLGEEGVYAEGWVEFAGAAIGSDCTSSPCTAYEAVGTIGSGMSATRTGTGAYTITTTGWKNGIRPVCSIPHAGGRLVQVTRSSIASSGSSTFDIIAYTSTPSAIDTVFSVKCKGEVNP